MKHFDLITEHVTTGPMFRVVDPVTGYKTGYLMGNPATRETNKLKPTAERWSGTVYQQPADIAGARKHRSLEIVAPTENGDCEVFLMGLWFEGRILVGFDGAYAISRTAARCIRMAGYIIPQAML